MLITRSSTRVVVPLADRTGGLWWGLAYNGMCKVQQGKLDNIIFGGTQLLGRPLKLGLALGDCLDRGHRGLSPAQHGATAGQSQGL